MYACVSVLDLAHLAWPGVCSLSSSHRVGVWTVCEWLPVCGQLLLWRGRGERHPPSQQPLPSQCTQGAYRNVRGGWPWQPTSPVQWSQEAQVGHAPVMMSCLFTGLKDGKETSGNVMSAMLSALQTTCPLFVTCKALFKRIITIIGISFYIAEQFKKAYMWLFSMFVWPQFADINQQDDRSVNGRVCVIRSYLSTPACFCRRVFLFEHPIHRE